MKVAWRGWYEAKVIAQLTAFGTLPREEMELEVNGFDDGEDVAQMIAEHLNSVDSEQMREGGRVVILEPEEYAGTYDVTVDYEPVFAVRKQDDE